MKKIILVIVILAVLAPLTYCQKAGQDDIITAGNVLTRFYVHTAAFLGASSRYKIIDSTTAFECINAAAGVITSTFPAAETTDYLGLTAATEVYSFNNSDIGKIAYVAAVGTDDLEYPLQETSKDKLGLYRDATGLPAHYCLWNKKINVVPVNDSSDSLVVYYYATNNALSAATDTSNIPYQYLNLWSLYSAKIALAGKAATYGSVAQQYLELFQLDIKAEESKFNKINEPLIDKLVP